MHVKQLLDRSKKQFENIFEIWLAFKLTANTLFGHLLIIAFQAEIAERKKLKN